MKYLFFVLISLPAFACKMTSDGYESKVYFHMKELLKREQLTIKKNSWSDGLYVIMVEGKSGCRIRNYKITQDGTCRINTGLISDRACQ